MAFQNAVNATGTGLQKTDSSGVWTVTTTTNHNLLIGAAANAITNVAPSATSGVPVISQGAASDPIFGTAVVAGGGTGLATLTAHALQVGNGTSAITQLGPTATAGQYLQSAGSSADPAFSTATLPSTATGTGTLLRADGNNWVATTSTYPNTNAVSTLLYASSANVMAALATANNGILVTSATGVPSILAGPGTTGNVLQANAAAAPSYSTATYPSVATGTGTLLRADGTNWVATTSTYPTTNAVSTLLYASSANVMSALATTNRASLSTNSTGVPTWLALTDGQLVIGSTAGSPAAGSITSTGATISVSLGSNTINLEVVGGGFTWSDVTGATQAMAVQNGYISDRGGGVTFTLPATAALGAEILVVGKLGLWTIAQNANQQIVIGSASTTVGIAGSLASTNVGDCISLIAIVSGSSTIWRANSFVGNITAT